MRTNSTAAEVADLLERERLEASEARKRIEAPIGARVRTASDPSDRLIPVAEAAARLGKASRATIYTHFARGTLTKHVLNGRTLVDATELEPLMFEPSSEAPRPARAAPLPLSLNQSVPHASRRLRADDEHHRRRVEHLLEDLLDELRSLRTSLLTHGRARP